MRVLLQRVAEATVEVEGAVVGSINRGLLAFVGVGKTDDVASAKKMADKVANLRIFDDGAGKTNLSLLDVNGEALVVAQFTLYADCRKGRRPSFTDAGHPDVAASLVEEFRTALADRGVPTASGVFAAHMKVHLVNDGPFTVYLEDEQIA